MMDDRLAYWRRFFELEWPGQELVAAVADKFLDRVEVVDPSALVALAGRPMLFLANHQCYLESLVFSYAVPPLCGVPATVLAKSAHRGRWLGRLVELVFGWPGLRPHHAVEYIDRDDPGAPAELLARLSAVLRRGSLLVHVEGTRRRSAQRGRVLAVSPLWAELALATGAPVVPVRFVGGLPIDDGGAKLDAPVGMGKQMVRLGRPITSDELASVAAEERAGHLRAAINALQDCRTETPGAPDERFAAAAEEWSARTGAEPMAAVLLEALIRRVERGPGRDPGDRCAALVAVARLHREGRTAVLRVSDDDEGRWLAGLAAFLFGPRGPAVVEHAAAARQAS
jgi:1-acyl-sn-glycerol-3-phosphate acyltransferase